MTDTFDNDALDFETEALDPLEISQADLEQYAPRSVEELNISLPQYEFIELLAVGGMGAIYKALQPKLDRLIAVKLLPEMVNDKYGFADRFAQEAKAMAKLSHPHIVPIFDFGETNQGQAYFVMEYVEGADLLRYLHGGQLTLAHFFGWIPQVCSAIQYAHNRDIVHRDIKPANILIDKEGNVKMADFGLAKLTGAQPARDTEAENLVEEEQDGDISMGTPGYAAPEQFGNEEQVDGRADIYSLGVVMYQMLTGGMPAGAFPMPSEINPHIDIRVDEVVMRAMQQDPDDRFQSISEISERLSIIQATENDEPDEIEPVAEVPVAHSGKRLITGAVQTTPPHQSTSSGSVSTVSGKVAIPTDRVAAAGSAASLKTGRIANMPSNTATPKSAVHLRRAIDKRNQSVSPIAIIAIIAVIAGIIYVVAQAGKKPDDNTENSDNTSQGSLSENSTAPVKEPKPNPNTEAGRRLAAIEGEEYEHYDLRIKVPYDASVEKLNALFLKTLNSQKADADAKDLEDPKLSAAFQAEIDRVTKGESPQETEAADFPKKILKMRANYFQKLNLYEQERQANIDLFEQELDSKFQNIQEEYTNAQNTDAAREVEYYRTNRSRWKAAQIQKDNSPEADNAE